MDNLVSYLLLLLLGGVQEDDEDDDSRTRLCLNWVGSSWILLILRVLFIMLYHTY